MKNSIKLKGVRMDNTISSDISWKVVASKAINGVIAELAPLSKFSTDFSGDSLLFDKAVLPKVAVKLVTSMGSATKNATNFGTTTNATISAVEVTLNRYSVPFNITPADRSNGIKMSDLISAAANTVAKAIAADISTVVNANTTNVITLAGSAISASACTTEIFPAIEGEISAMVLDKVSYGTLLPTATTQFSLENGAYGINAIHYMYGTTDATNHGIGFAARQDGLAVASRLPDLPSSEYSVMRKIDIPEIGLSFLYYQWFDKDTQKEKGCVDVLFGCALGTPTGVKQIRVTP